MAGPPMVKAALFNGLYSDDLDLFEGLSSVRTFDENKAIVSEGDPGDGMFVVSAGEVRVEKATLDQKQESSRCSAPVSASVRSP